jgi:8-oxo-dGTP pyrophosphatase MutT (NUDIX family)
MSEIWKPSVTVAAIVEDNGRFLLVEEETADGLRINQPAGHLESGESLEQAVVREALEETAYDFYPDALVGMYILSYASDPGKDATYLRFAFAGRLGQFRNQPLDPDIVRTVWMTREELQTSRARHRSPLVMQCVDDYLLGKRAPLSLLYTHTVRRVVNE